jgi:hypothetical protein
MNDYEFNQYIRSDLSFADNLSEEDKSEIIALCRVIFEKGVEEGMDAVAE